MSIPSADTVVTESKGAGSVLSWNDVYKEIAANIRATDDLHNSFALRRQTSGYRRRGIGDTLSSKIYDDSRSIIKVHRVRPRAFCETKTKFGIANFDSRFLRPN
jgi:hypothetical protein